MDNAMKVRVQTLQRDCTRHCKSVVHGNMITAAITKRSSTDLELCSYLNFLCGNCESVKDAVGRTALHLAASCGRIELLRWLVNVKKANIDIRDKESGYTALHRALYYGNIDIAVELIKLGANTSIMDMNSLTAFEHVLKDGGIPWQEYGQVFTWGLNRNNSLGPFSARTFPEYLDSFHRRFPNTNVQQVCLGKFHSILVDTNGGVYSCGHGLGGRLGLGSEKSVVEPTKIRFDSPDKAFIVNACIGRDHCLFMASDQTLYTVGLNKYKVLGVYPPPEKATSPIIIKNQIKTIYGICAATYHSAVWTSKALFVWGLNVGQLGASENNYQIITPRKVRLFNIEETFIKKVACSDGAIGVVSGKGDIYILHEYRCRKIASRFVDAAEISLIGGKLNTDLDPELKNDQVYELKVLIRTHIGRLYLWQESDPYLCRCVFSIPREITVKKAFINAIEISFVSELGEAFKGTIRTRKRKSSIENKNKLQNFLYRDNLVSIDIRKISRIQRAISIVSDPKGDDYCIIQQEPYQTSLKIFRSDSEMKTQLETLFRESHEEDGLHDVKIKIGNTVFPGHKYILARGSQVLRELFDKHKNNEIVLKDISEDIFREMILFIYTGTCDILVISKHMEEYQKYSFSGNGATLIWENQNERLARNPVRRLLEAAKLYMCCDLLDLLSNVDLLDAHLINKKCPDIGDDLAVFDVNYFPDYYDVVLKCDDGVEVNAHKCMLAARMDYFRSMFSARWKSGTTSILFPYPSNIAEALLNFVYTDSTNFLSDYDCDFLMRLLIASDEYLLLTLKKHCENILLTHLLDLKTAADLLTVAVSYRADMLREGVIRFIVSNMAYFLEIQALDELSDEILKELAQCYFLQNLVYYNRIITPDSTAVSDESMDEIKKTYPADADERVESKMTKSAPRNIKRKGGSTKVISETSEKKTIDKVVEALDRVTQFPETTAIIPHEENCSSFKKRLSAISYAAAIVETENYPIEFENIKERLSEMSTSFEDFPILNSPPRNSIYGDGPSHGKIVNRSENKHRISRLSQRERKRLSSESKDASQTPESPKNPWKVIPPLSSSPIVSPSSEAAFCDILLSERKQKGNLVKMTNKLLMHTQMEDKAIADLEKFYNVANIEDEIIIIHRVDTGRVACPVWVPKKQAHS